VTTQRTQRASVCMVEMWRYY